ncbi:hypothetical protein NDU88_003324 [Pleurodeles waltl]|uniref:Uncharacterized protein n=1 Tax=Pleurodeles waltl TaxID=8319 RepID=A0AAV7NGI1_PLEWA|nr:hypothetical protein NDU88_003324 [Pleurodeles waltl]
MLGPMVFCNDPSCASGRVPARRGSSQPLRLATTPQVRKVRLLWPLSELPKDPQLVRTRIPFSAAGGRFPPAACCTIQRTWISAVIEAAVASADANRVSSAVLLAPGNGFRPLWALPPVRAK